MSRHKDIYDLVIQQENAYLKPIELEDGWTWSMKEHLRRSFLYKNSQFEELNENRDTRPFKNIVRPILNIAYRTEGFDVKDIELYVDNPDLYYKSFLVDKFHDKWAVENEIDTFIDDLVESYVDYGGVLVRNTDKARPEVVDLRSLAFCSQTDLLAYPFGIKHELSYQELRGMDKWDADEIEKLIGFAKMEDKDTIEVYEVHGIMPEGWVEDSENDQSVNQIQVVSFFTDINGNEQGITLFSSKEPKLPFKFLARDQIYNRALGFGGIEELFDAQQWTNYSEIAIIEMLNLASKVLYKSNDPAFKTRNNLSNVETGEVLTLQEARDINQLDTSPRNLAVFNDAMDRWEITAQKIGSASEGQLGESPASGTPFKLFEAQQIEARGMHRYRQGKIAVFVEEIYREWILPYINREIKNEQKFLAELSGDEVMEVVEKVTRNVVNKEKIERILNGELVFPEEMQAFEQTTRETLIQRGNKWFMKIFKGEMDKEPIGISTNIAGKQKNLALLTDKIVNVLRQFISTPEIRQDPEMVKLLNTILESSGMSPIMFGASPQAQLQPVQPQAGGGTEPLKALGQATREEAKAPAVQ